MGGGGERILNIFKNMDIEDHFRSIKSYHKKSNS